MTYFVQQKDDSSYRLVESETTNTVLCVRADSDVVVRAVNSIARTDTTAKNLFVIPANAIPIRLQLYSATASDAGTTATIAVGKTGTSNYFLAAYDVKGNSGQLTPATVSHFLASVGTADIQVVGIYAETGTASTTGGPIYVMLEYYVA